MSEKEGAGSACMHADTCLVSQCILRDEVSHLLVQPGGRGHHLHSVASRDTHTHKRTHSLAHKALPHVASWHPPYTSPSLSLCIRLTRLPVLPVFSGVSFHALALCVGKVVAARLAAIRPDAPHKRRLSSPVFMTS